MTVVGFTYLYEIIHFFNFIYHKVGYITYMKFFSAMVIIIIIFELHQGFEFFKILIVLVNFWLVGH